MGIVPDSGGYLLHEPAILAQIARDAADHAMGRGVAQVIASASETGGVTMRAREGRFDSAMREGVLGLSITVFDGGRTGKATTSALDRDAVRSAVEHAIAIAREVEPDADAAPPDPLWMAREAPDIPMYDPSHLSVAALGETALTLEAAALDQGVRVADAGASTVDGCAAIAIGRDFDRSLTASYHSLWCAAIAERDGVMTRDHWASVDRRLTHLLPPREVGATAARRVKRKLGARTLSTRTCPVILDAVVASSLVREVASALSGGPQYRGATFLREGKGMTALASHLDLMEDPFEPFGLASGACDSEGVGGTRRAIIREGVVEDLFLSCLHARKLGLRSTGNADGVRNLTLSSRLPAEPVEGLCARMGDGLWVTELTGGSVDPVTGSYSKAAAGFWIRDGEVAFPVHDITIAGDLPAMLRGIVAMAGDIHRSGAIRTGSLLIETMHVAGR